MGIKSPMILVSEEYSEKMNIPKTPGLVLKGPYEYQIKITKKITSCELMYDLLIDGKIYKQIPCKFCKKLRI